MGFAADYAVRDGSYTILTDGWLVALGYPARNGSFEPEEV
jgi:hypothetical protein